MSASLAGMLSPYAPNVAASSTRLQPQDSSSTTPATGEAGLSSTNLGTTFLQLLGQELQNQDPTQPMDPTQEVGQLISLNQLNELISINDVITGTGSSTAAASGSSQHKSVTNPAADLLGNQTDASAAAQALAASGANSSTQPLDLGTLLSLYGGK